MRELYIAKRPDGRDIAVVEDGRLVEYLCDRDAGQTAENVYLGRVERVMPGMRAAFVDIGQEKNGFLPLDERNLPHAEKLQAGMAVPVQVRKEAHGGKGAFLSRDITLCGESVLVMPMNRTIGVSSRIEEEALREEMRALGKTLAGDRCGLVMRSASANLPEKTIREETEALLAQWETIRQRIPTAHVPSLIYRARTLLESAVDDYRPRGLDRIHTNDEALADRLAPIAPVMRSAGDPIALMGFDRQLEKALERRVWLKSGGTLVFDVCEAMTVIDVNTAKFTGKRQLEETILRLNLEACAEIARQTRLRNLSGIILIDMIDMASEDSRRKVLAALEDAFAADRVKTVVHGFTSLGLVEMTRKRARPPLRDERTKLCPLCQGQGFVKEESNG